LLLHCVQQQSHRYSQGAIFLYELGLHAGHAEERGMLENQVKVLGSKALKDMCMKYNIPQVRCRHSLPT